MVRKGWLPRRLWQVVSALLVLAGCVVAAVPLAPAFPAAEVDSAWMFAINAAVGLGLRFGRDLVFTFGPYASLYTLSYHPATDGLAMATSPLLAAALAAGMVALTPDRGRWRAILLAVGLSLLWLRDPLFFMVPLVFLAVVARLVARRRQSGRWLLATAGLLVVAMALLPLVKGTFAAAVAVALGLGCLLVLVRGRWRLAVAACAVFALAMAAFWLLAHQRLGDLPGFFAAQSLIVGGYTEAMSLPGPMWQVAAFAALAGVVLLLNLPAALRAGLPGLAVLAGAAALLLLAFKAGFVRQDEHIAIAAGALGLIAGVLTLANRGVAPALGLVVGLLGWGVLDYAAEAVGPRRAMLRVETVYREAARGALDRWHGGVALAQGYDAALAQIRREHPVPPLAGSSDIYSTGQSILLAYGLPWSPRPVLQSYSAYSPVLEQDDSSHLTGSAAPDNVLLTLEPMDGRFPALEDGLSWLPLLARYGLAALEGDMAILRRGAAGPSALGTPGPLVGHSLGEAVPLEPGGAPLWAEIDVQPTLLGRLLSAVFKPPPLRIVMHLATGKTLDFRYVSGMGRAGFLLSPVVATAAQLLSLHLPGLRAFDDYIPVSFAIEGDERFWRRGYTVSLTPLQVQPRPDIRSVLFPEPSPFTPSGGPAAKCWLDLVNGQVADHAKPLALSGLVRLNGWGFGEAGGAGVEPGAVTLSLRGGDGTVVAVPAVAQMRPDVGAYFHQPQLAHIGFQALADLRTLSGRFGMALEITTGDRNWSCPLIAPVDIVPGQP